MVQIWLAGTWSTNKCVKTNAVDIVDSTTYQFNTRINDNVSNVGAGTATIQYTGDLTAPTTTFVQTNGVVNNWNNINIIFTLSCADAGSGCDSTAYRIDSGSWVNYTVPVTISTDGNHQIDYNSTDAIGNIETTSIRNIAVDTNDPYTTFTQINGIIGAWNSGSVDFNLSCSDSK